MAAVKKNRGVKNESKNQNQSEKVTLTIALLDISTMLLDFSL